MYLSPMWGDEVRRENQLVGQHSREAGERPGEGGGIRVSQEGQGGCTQAEAFVGREDSA